MMLSNFKILKNKSITHCKQHLKRLKKDRMGRLFPAQIAALKEFIKVKQIAYFKHFQYIKGFKWEGMRKR